MTNKIPDLETRTSTQPLKRSESVSDEGAEPRFMKLHRVQDDHDTICEIHVDLDCRYRISIGSEPVPEEAIESWKLYISISNLQRLALEESIRHGLVAPAYLIRKSSMVVSQSGYIRVPLPSTVRGCIQIDDHKALANQRYRVDVEKCLTPRATSAIVKITDQNGDIVSTDYVPAGISPARYQVLSDMIKHYTTEPNDDSRELLRQLDVATAAVCACAE